MTQSSDSPPGLTEADYRTLAAFRYQLRRFMAFSRQAAEAAGLAPQQHQALLAIKGHAPAEPITVGQIAEQLFVRQHTAVELVDRMELAGLVRRSAAGGDARKVAVTLTPKAETALQSLSGAHLAELQRNGPLMAELLTLIKPAGRRRG